MEDKKEEHKKTLSNNICINLINSDNNMDELFWIRKYKDNKIRFHIFDDLQRFNLIENRSNLKIEFIEEHNVKIKVSKLENGTVKNDISFSAT